MQFIHGGHDNQKDATEQHNLHTRSPFRDYGHKNYFLGAPFYDKKLPIYMHPRQFDPTESHQRVQFDEHHA